MKNDTIKHVLFWIFVFSIAFLLNSCGARKSQIDKSTTTEKSKTETVIQLDHKTEVQANSNQNSNTATHSAQTSDSEMISEEVTDKPIDPTKPMIVTGPNGQKITIENGTRTIKKKWKKAKVIAKAKTNFQSNIQTNTNQKSAVTLNKKSSSVVKKDAFQKTKSVQKESSWYLNLLWLLIPLVLYFLYQKFKDKIWFI